MHWRWTILRMELAVTHPTYFTPLRWDAGPDEGWDADDPEEQGWPFRSFNQPEWPCRIWMYHLDEDFMMGLVLSLNNRPFYVVLMKPGAETAGLITREGVWWKDDM